MDYRNNICNYIYKKTNFKLDDYYFSDVDDYRKYESRFTIDQILNFINKNKETLSDPSFKCSLDFNDGFLFFSCESLKESEYMCCGNPRSSPFILFEINIPINLKIKRKPN